MLKRGDLDSLCAAYFETVLQWIRATGRVSVGEAEEIRQMVFVRFVREVRQGHQCRLPIGAALFRIADWTTKGYIAAAATQGEREQVVRDIPGEEPVDPNALREMEQVGQDDDVKAIFARLPDRERVLMMLHTFDDLSLTQCAEAMGIEPNNAHQIHHRAMRRIARWIAEEGV
ncbi:MAG: sigma-70 family RNA polymerase sigma factor [Thermoleophilia bacterium]|nr:sigma-70 family RNA polymerase sigma factor [Thermoleophilia bacterium]